MENTNKNDHDLHLSADGEWTDLTSGPTLDLEHELAPAEHYEELPAAPEIEALPVVATEAEVETVEPVAVVAPEKVEVRAPEAVSTLSAEQIAMIRSWLDKIEEQTKQIKNILEPYGLMSAPKLKIATEVSRENKETDGQVVEGWFDGQEIIGPDGQQYAIPANYASKSRLVEGDLMKLVITKSGSFIFKQIKPVDRRRVTGILEESETGDFFVLADDRRWRVLAASVTYYKGEAGDQTVIMVPRNGMSKWGAVENIIRK
jgi:hypothetical protein